MIKFSGKALNDKEMKINAEEKSALELLICENIDSRLEEVRYVS